MNLFRYWWTGLVHPSKAFESLAKKPAPSWGFWIVLVFNLLISSTTLLPLVLLHRLPFLSSWLTFLPTDKYLLAEIFFLPPLRLAVWLIGAAIIHLGLRLAKQASNYDILLNIGGLGYLVIMPLILVSDWLLIGLNAYWLAEYTHPLAAFWGVVLSVIGLEKLLGVRKGVAIGLVILSTALSLPLLAVFAR
jgi:Yip1 domain